MAKVKCPSCNQIFEATDATPQMSCPYCGKTYNNPYYDASAKSQLPAPVSKTTSTMPSPQGSVMKRGDSKFTGGLGSLIGLRIANFFILIFTLFLGTPLVICRSYRWHVQHQIIDGYKLVFDGKAGQLFGQWIKWMLLSLITIGIYGFWVPIKKQKWITEHTHLEVA